MSKFIPVGGKNLRLLAEQGAMSWMGCGNDAGFTAAAALRIATLQSARAMGVEAQFGSISPGKTADRVVLDGDPLQDFHPRVAPCSRTG